LPLPFFLSFPKGICFSPFVVILSEVEGPAVAFAFALAFAVLSVIPK